MFNPVTEVRKAINEMRRAGLSRSDVIWEIVAATSVIAAPIAAFVLLSVVV